MESLVSLVCIMVIAAGGILAPFYIAMRAIFSAVIALIIPISGFWPFDYLIYIWLFLTFTTRAGLMLITIFIICFYWGKHSTRS